MLDLGEFDMEGAPTRRNGMTSIQAIRFLREAHPEVPHWVCWEPCNRCVGEMIRDADRTEGSVGPWRWRRVSCPYPSVPYYDSTAFLDRGVWRWTGMLDMTGPKGERFLIFSYLDSSGRVGTRFFVSTFSEAIIEQFLKDVRAEAEKSDQIRIDRVNAESITLNPSATEWVMLPQRMQEDIETQVFTFFERRAAYERLGVPYRRGLLFAGPPGVGKTLMLRRLVRECHKRFRTWALSIKACASVDADNLSQLFKMASERGPSLVILDDMDSLLKQTRLTRAALLEELDGLQCHEGVLVIGTTNNPAEIDPALAHRPSRFDRVWRFELPAADLRMAYFRHTLDGIDRECLEELVRKTEGWSYAYMNELRTSAAILATRENGAAIEERHLFEAVHLLGAQFNSGKKGHAGPPAAPVGFTPTEDGEIQSL